jgi:hypothetical protein
LRRFSFYRDFSQPREFPRWSEVFHKDTINRKRKGIKRQALRKIRTDAGRYSRRAAALLDRNFRSEAPLFWEIPP